MPEPLNHKVKALYTELKNGGANVGTEQEFNDWFFANGDKGYQNRKAVYNELRNGGANVGANYEEFRDWLGLHPTGQGASRPGLFSRVKAEAKEKTKREGVGAAQRWAKRMGLVQQQPTQRQTAMDDALDMGAQVLTNANDERVVNDLANGGGGGKGGYKPTQEEMRQFESRLQNMQDQTEYARGQWEKQRDYQRSIMDNPIGNVDNVVKGGYRINPQTGKMEQSYLTSSGNVYYGDEGRAAATMEQRDIDKEMHGWDQGAALRGDVDSMDKRLDELYEETVKKAQDDYYAEQRGQGMGGGFWENAAWAMAHSGPQQVAGNAGFNSAWSHIESNPDVVAVESARRTMRDVKRIIEEADRAHKDGLYNKWRRTFVGGALAGVWQKATDLDTWDFGASDAKEAGAILGAIKAFDSGKELTPAQQALLDSKALELAVNSYFGSDVGAGYKAGQVTGESLPFMVEMALNPLSSTGNAAVKALARYGIKRFGKKALKKGGSRYLAGKATRVAGRVLGDVAGAAGMAATTGALRVGAGTMERMAGDINPDTDKNGHTVFGGHENGEDFVTAFAKSFGATTIDNHSELLGEYFTPMFKLLGKPIAKGASKLVDSKFGKFVHLDNVVDFIKNSRVNDVANLVTEFEREAKWHGVIGEFSEELAGGIENALLVGDQTLDADKDTGVFNTDNLKDTFLGVSLLGGFFSGIKTVGYRTPKYRAKKAMSKADANASALFMDKARWASIRESIQNADLSDVKGIIDVVMRDSSLSQREKQAAMDYVHASMTYRGMEMAQEKRGEDDTQDPAQATAEQSYEDGYNAADAQAENDIQQAYNECRKQMAEKYGEEGMAAWDSDPIGSLQTVLDDENTSVEDRQLALDYVNSKAAVDGVADRKEDNIDERVDQATAAVDVRVSSESRGGDGMIHPVTLTDGRTVDVIGGTVAPLDDGSIDRKKSNNDLIVRDQRTGKVEFVSADAVTNVGQAIDPTQLKTEAENAIRQEQQNQDVAAQQQVAQQQGQQPTEQQQAAPEVTFNGGEHYSAVDKAGNPVEIDVVEDLGNDMVEVSINGGEARPQSKSALIELITGQQPTQQATQSAPTQQETPQAEQQPTQAAQQVEQPTASAPVQGETTDAMPMIGEGEDAEADFMATTPERGHRYIYDENGLTKEEGDQFVEANIAKAEKALEEAKKNPPKMGDKMSKYKRAKAEYEAKVAAAQAAVDYWNNVKALAEAARNNQNQDITNETGQGTQGQNVAPTQGTDTTVEQGGLSGQGTATEPTQNEVPRTETGRGESEDEVDVNSLFPSPDEIEQDVRKGADERAQRISKAKSYQRKLKVAREIYGDLLGDPDEPNTALEYVAQSLPYRSLALNDYEQGMSKRKGLSSELGWNGRLVGRGADAGKYAQYFAKPNPMNPKEGGQSPRQVAHELWDAQPEVNGEKRWSDDEIFEALLEVFSLGSTRAIRDYTLDNRIAEAEAMMSGEAMDMANRIAEEYMERYHLNADEVEGYVAYLRIEQPIIPTEEQQRAIDERLAEREFARGEEQNIGAVSGRNEENNVSLREETNKPNNDEQNTTSNSVDTESQSRTVEGRDETSGENGGRQNAEGNGLATPAKMGRSSSDNAVVGGPQGTDEVDTEAEALAENAERAAEIRKKDPLRTRAKEWAKRLGVKANIIESIDDVKNASVRRALNEGRKIDGWFDVDTGEVCIYMPNIDNADQIDKTYLHEVVGHLGLRNLFKGKGKATFDKLCDDVYKLMTEAQRKSLMNKAGIVDEKDETKRRRKIADEFMARMAESGEYNPSIIRRIKTAVKELLRSLNIKVKLTDADIEAMLRQSRRKLEKEAEDKQEEERGTSNGNVRFSERDNGSLNNVNGENNTRKRGNFVNATVSPFYDKTVNDNSKNGTAVEQAADLRRWVDKKVKKDENGNPVLDKDGKPIEESRWYYNEYIQTGTRLATALGLTVHDIKDNIGGWQFESEEEEGRTIQEISQTWVFSFPDGMSKEEAREKADLFACLLGDLGPEVQEAVISADYVDEGDINANALEFTIGVKDVDKALEELEKAGFTDFTIDQNEKIIKLDYFIDRDNPDVDEDRKNEFADRVENLKKIIEEDENFDGRRKDGTEKASRLIEAEDRRRRYETWLDSDQMGEQDGTTRSLVQQALERVEEFQRAKGREANLADEQRGVQGESHQDADGEARVQQGTGGSRSEQPVLERNTKERHDKNTQDFFSGVLKGEKYHDYKKKWEPWRGLDEGQEEALTAWEPFDGGFSTHINISIPYFREMQLTKIYALSKYLGKGQKLIDLCGSQADFSKAVATLNPTIKADSVDINSDMKAEFEKKPVNGVKFKLESVLGDYRDDSTGKYYPEYTPKEKGDVVHETMGFQFIMKDRQDFVDRIADHLLKKDGVAILEEKIHPETLTEWCYNEAQKDIQFKSVYWKTADVAKKKAEVLVGMGDDQADESELERALKSRFKHVARYWKSGNFVGYIASNNEDNFKRMRDLIGDTRNEFELRGKDETAVIPEDTTKDEAEESQVMFREVDDPETIERLENGPTIRVYRAMQLIDGELYPPMSARVDGELRQPTRLNVWEEAEEQPEKADGKGYFKLDKGNKKSLKARYNPYFHTSRTMLNDQFSEAQNRDNLVVVECEVPVSELASGYKAEKAKDSVGAKMWKAGVIQGQLSGKREVILSRWAKPIRIVPTYEVADDIVKHLNGEVPVMPSNVVTPQVRRALEARGIQFVETDNKGKIVDGENKGKTWASVYGKKAKKKGGDVMFREGEEPTAPRREMSRNERREMVRRREKLDKRIADLEDQIRPLEFDRKNVGETYGDMAEKDTVFYSDEWDSSRGVTMARRLTREAEELDSRLKPLREERDRLVEERDALVQKISSTFVKPTAKEQRERNAYADRQRRNAKHWAGEWVKKLNIEDNTDVYDSIDDVPNADDMSEDMRRARGWFDTKTGKIVIILGNHRSPGDVVKTILHEAVAHYGLRELFGERFDTFLDNVYNGAELDIQARIMAIAAMNSEYRTNPEKRDAIRREATEEYLARLAENMNDGVSSTDGPIDSTETSFLGKVKEWFLNMLESIGLPRRFLERITDNELQYILWRSYKNLTAPDLYMNRFGGQRRQTAQVVDMRPSGLIENEIPQHTLNYDDEQDIKRRVSELSLDEAVKAYHRIDDSMRNEDGLDIDEQHEAIKKEWFENGRSFNLGKREAELLDKHVQQYGGGRVELRYALIDRIEALGGSVKEEAEDVYYGDNVMFREGDAIDSEELFDRAKKKFGVTNDIREAGYVLPDGAMLDFSGRHELFGADDSGLRGRRTTDHRAISSLAYDYDEDGNEVDTGIKTDMPDFIERGAIRIDDNAGAINLSQKPTRAQAQVLRRLISRNDGEVTVEIGNGWDTQHYGEYDEGTRATKVLGDIDHYFDDGIMFREEDAAYMDAVNNGDMKTAKRMVKEAAKMAMPETKVVDENGEPMVVYHGSHLAEFYYKDGNPYTRWIDRFNTFKEGKGFFTEDREAALHIGAGKRGLYACYLNISKPFIFDVGGARWDSIDFNGKKYQTTDHIVQWAKEQGLYDGVIIKNVVEQEAENGDKPITNYLAFRPNQIKSADPVTYDDNGNVIPLSERFNEENNDIRFREEDEKTLMGVHNISEDKLRKAIKQGGLANPSLAVIDTDNHMHTDYGEISLIPRSSLIDKKTGRNAGTYSGDAWTPTYPHVERRLTAQGDNHIKKIAMDASNGDQDVEKHLLGNLNYYIEGNGDHLHFLFLTQKGLNPEIRRQRITHSHEEYEAVRKLLGDDFRNVRELTDEQNDALMKMMMAPAEEDARESVANIEDADKRNKYYDVLLKMARDRIADENGRLFFAKWDTYLDGIARDEYRRQHPQTDWLGTDNAAMNRVATEGLSEEYAKWKESLFNDGDISEVLFAGFTPSGNRKYLPNTVENASRLMNREADTNSYNNNGFSATRSNLLQKFSSLKDIRKHKGLIRNDDVVADRAKELSDELFDIVDQLSSMERISDNRFMNLDYASARLQEAITKRDPIGYLNDEYGYSIQKDGELASQIKDFIADTKKLPVKYFETKFKRPVGLDEFAIAVVPETASEDIVDALKSAGLDVRQYDGTDEDRKAVTLDAVRGRNDIMFREEDDIFVSNARRAVEGIKQEKAAPAQWLAMIQKNGGLKAGEDKWLGLSDWLKGQDKKSLTKDEVLDYIRENQVQIEEVEYQEDSDVDNNPNMNALREEFLQLVEEGEEATNSIYISDHADWALEQMRDRYGDDFLEGFEWNKDRNGYPMLDPIMDWDGGISDAARYYLDIQDKPINSTRLGLTTDGLDNKKEIALVVPTVEPYHGSMPEVHFDDEHTGGRAVAWIRFGETTAPRYETVVDKVEDFEEPLNNMRYTLYYPKGKMRGKDYVVYGRIRSGEMKYVPTINEQNHLGAYDTLEEAREKLNEYYAEHPRSVKHNNRVLVIDEVQSQRHQDAREKGYKNTKAERQLDEFRSELAKKYPNGYANPRMTAEQLQDIRRHYPSTAELTAEEKDKYRSLLNAVGEKEGIPDAPFEKNWYELAMKRMLRYAAENGYDKVAWTKGAQQAERYNLSDKVDEIKVAGGEDNIFTVIGIKDGGILVQKDVEGENGLADLIGKDMARKAYSNLKEGKEDYLNEDGAVSFTGDDLSIGGEGMKGFYDDILPRFMNKYSKKWGVKVGEVELPNVEEAGRHMWSVDVTPEMRESVMGGQVMFHEADSIDENEETEGEEQNVTPEQANEARANIERAAGDDWRDSFEVSLRDGLLSLAERTNSTVDQRMEAVKRIVERLVELRERLDERKAESAARGVQWAQKEYDRETLSDLIKLVRMMMAHNKTDNMTLYETSRLVGMLGEAVGKDDVSAQARKIIDLMLKKQVRDARNIFFRAMSIRGTKVNAKGVEVQGQLSVDGVRMMRAFKDALDLDAEQLQERIADCEDRMGDTHNEVRAKNAAIELQGLMMAKQYMEEVGQSIQEEKTIREEIRKEKEDYGPNKQGLVGEERKAAIQAHKEFVREAQDNLFENWSERIKAYERLTSTMGEGLRRSIEEAREWQEEQKRRVQDIQHNANSDLEGMNASEHDKLPKKNGWRHSLVRLLMNPVATADEMFRDLGRKHANGEGYLWNRFIRGWRTASDREWRKLHAAHQMLDKKVSEVFGKDMRWSDLFAVERKMKGMDVEFWDDGERTPHTLSQGNMLYIYMVNKMADGRMKLRRMGITEGDVANIVENLDPRFIQLADWLQDEFLVSKRNEYNEVHERMFGASMASIDNYFPLKVNPRSRGQQEDVSTYDNDEHVGGTVTGSVIKRTKNAIPLDVMGADAFDVVLEHLQKMEHWAAFAELSRDLNTLLSYRKFKNRLLHMKSVRFGTGKEYWNNFKNVCAILAGEYRPKTRDNGLDNTLMNVAKGVTAAKIAFRIYTAFKQLLSSPAYLSEASPVELLKYNPVTSGPIAWNWAIENLPGFAERWQSRKVGDSRLMDTDSDWDIWHNKIIEKLSRWGMTPNAFVDGLTVACGAKAIYETKYKRYIKDGYTEEQAREKALQDASISYNETQQSSEAAFMSAAQLDRTAASVALTVFRNCSMGYQRRFFRALSNLKQRSKKGYKDSAIEYMTKQMVRDGLTEEQAAKAAKRAYRRGLYKDMADVAIFGWVLQFAWNMGPNLVYMFVGGDDDDKQAMLEDAAIHALFGGVEGLAAGNVISDTTHAILTGNFNSPGSGEFNLLPFLSDISKTFKDFKKDWATGFTDVVNLLVQSNIGVNPQTISDMIVALADAFNGDMGAMKEGAFALMRILQFPSSQIEKLQLDELGINKEGANGVSAEDLMHRMADFKTAKNAPLFHFFYSDEEQEKADNRGKKRFDTLVREKLDTYDDDTLLKWKTDDPYLEDIWEKRVESRIGEMDDEALSEAYDLGGFVRKKATSVMAKRLGGSDYASGQGYKYEYNQEYCKYRNPFDVAEDVTLSIEKSDAKDANDDELYKSIDKVQKEITKMKKQLLEVPYTDTLTGKTVTYEDVMNEIRRYRSEQFNELGITVKR